MRRDHIIIAASLYRAQDAMRGFWGDEYASKVAECRYIIEKIKQSHKLDTIPAAMICIEKLREVGSDSGMNQVMMLATVVEIIEQEAT